MGLVGQHINLILNIVLAMIMLGLGISLRKEDFKQLFDQPKPLAIGLSAQMLLLPLIAFLLVYKSNLAPELKVGAMILSVCPGGITSNLVSYFVKGNVALAVSLTVSNAFLSLFSIPLMINLFLNYFMKGSNIQNEIHLPFFSTMIEIFAITIVPAGIGMLLRYRLGKKILEFQKVINILLPLLLLLVFTFKFLAGTQSGGASVTKMDIVQLTPIVIGLNVLSMFLGYLIGTPFGLSFKNRITISVEVGLHNTALALLIASQKLGVSAMEKPALVYALFSFFVTFFVAWVLVRLRLYRLKKRG
jgi:BASS family bile acid:Na+ symporter